VQEEVFEITSTQCTSLSIDLGLRVHLYYLGNFFDNINQAMTQTFHSIPFRLMRHESLCSHPHYMLQAELERGETANSILCYMQDTGVCENVAREHIKELIDTAWKKMNRYQVNNSLFGKSFVRLAFNLARIAHHTYRDGDAHGAPNDRSKLRIHSLLIDPISLE